MDEASRRDTWGISRIAILIRCCEQLEFKLLFFEVRTFCHKSIWKFVTFRTFMRAEA